MMRMFHVYVCVTRLVVVSLRFEAHVDADRL